MRWGVLAASAAVFLTAEVGLSVYSSIVNGHGSHTPASTSLAAHKTDQMPKMLYNWDDGQAGLTADRVVQPSFGKAWSTTLDHTTQNTPNQLYAEPVEFDNKVYVASDDNEVEILDEQTGRKIAARNLGTPWTPQNCGDLTPHIGITGTPTIDPSTHTIYLITKLQVPGSRNARLEMWGLSTDTLATKPGWPLDLKGMPSDSSIAFNPTTANQRTGLTLDDKHAVYFATASHCNQGPFVGYVGRVTTNRGSPGSVHLWSDETAHAIDSAGIWQSGGALMTDGNDTHGNPRLFVATGTGTPPGNGPGNKPPGQLGQAVIRLGVNDTTGNLQSEDFFSPTDNESLDGNDEDLGSGTPVGLPASFGTARYPHLVTVAGKAGTAYLLNRDDLGGMGQGPSGSDASLSSLDLGSGVWGHAAAFDGGTSAHRLVYYEASHKPLQAFTTTPNGAGVPTLTRVGVGSQPYDYGASSPMITSDGQDAGTAVVWLAVSDGNDGTNGKLVAYPAVPPVSGSWKPLAVFPIGMQNKFAGISTSAGKVILGTKDGRVLAFGSRTNAAVSATSATFAPQPADGTTHTKTVTLTAREDVTVVRVTASSSTAGASFGVASQPGATRVHLRAGQKMSIDVSFRTRTPGLNAGRIDVQATPDATRSTGDYFVALSGTGTRDGILALPGKLSFGRQPDGVPSTQILRLENTGTSPITIAREHLAAGAFALAGSSPPAGYQIPPLQTATFTVRFDPHLRQAYSDQLVIDADLSSTGRTYRQAVGLSGHGVVGTPKLAITGRMYVNGSVDFNTVAPGTSETQVVTIKNVGNVPDRLNKAAVPSAPFIVPHPIDEGLTLDPGQSVSVDITAVPTTGNSETDHYIISDANGWHYIWLKVNEYRAAGELRNAFGCVSDYHLIRTNGNPVVDATCDGTAAQKLGMDANGAVHFFASYGDFCMDPVGGGTAAGTAIQLWTCTKGASQRWTWSLDGRLVNIQSGLCLGVRNNDSSSGTPLALMSCTPALTGEIWDPTGLVNTRGELTSGLGADGQYCVTGPRYGAARGAGIVVRTCELQTFGGLDTSVENAKPSQVIADFANTLRVAGGCLAPSSPLAGSPVTLAKCSYATSLQWLPGANGSVVNKQTHACLEVAGGAPGATGTRDLVAAPCDGSTAQSFVLPTG